MVIRFYKLFMLVCIGVLLLSFVAVGVSYSDVLYLKSGKKVFGEIIGQDSTGNVKVDVGGAAFDYFYDEIRKIHISEIADSSEDVLALKEDTPKKFIERFLLKQFSKEFKGLQDFYSKKMWKELKGFFTDSAKLHEIRFDDLHSYKIIQEESSQNSSVITILYVYRDREIKEAFTLVKINGEWKIDSSRIINSF